MNHNRSSAVSVYSASSTSTRKRKAVLNSLGIPSETVYKNGRWHIFVDESDFVIAERELAEYENELVELERKKKQHPELYNVNIYGFSAVLVSLFLFHFFSHGFLNDIEWFKQGRASADFITDGEWWRSVTALTLHVDAGHVMSNIVFGSIVFYSLARFLSSPISWMLVIFSGMSGNLMNAYFYGSSHNAVGASTAVFGAVGILGTLRIFKGFRHGKIKPWIYFGAALGLLGFLGSSKRTDVLAHLFGFVAGIPFGVLAGLFFGKQRQSVFSRFAGAVFSVVFPFACWAMALG
ncbi:MAG: rhomboid family intramembrane serine protease [bacterium]